MTLMQSSANASASKNGNVFILTDSFFTTLPVTLNHIANSFICHLMPVVRSHMYGICLSSLIAMVLISKQYSVVDTVELTPVQVRTRRAWMMCLHNRYHPIYPAAHYGQIRHHNWTTIHFFPQNFPFLYKTRTFLCSANGS